MKNKRIIIGSDHAGLRLKASLAEKLKEWGYEVEDIGCHSEDSTDYPLVSADLTSRFQSAGYEWGVLCCGSGIGVCMAANRYPFIRAVRAHDVVSAQMSRRHNDANVICFGQRFIAPELATEILKVWLETGFEGDRHQRRIDQMGTMGNKSQGEVSTPC